MVVTLQKNEARKTHLYEEGIELLGRLFAALTMG